MRGLLRRARVLPGHLGNREGRAFFVAMVVLGLALPSPAGAVVRRGLDDGHMSGKRAQGAALRQAASKPPYGFGANRLLDKVAPKPAPATRSATDYLKQAIADADKWWTDQGSAPPPLDLRIEPLSGRAGQAVLHSGQFSADPTSLSSIDTALRSGSLKKRRLALTQIWALAAHERGHNIGYEHTPDKGLMSDGIKSIPGRGYAWAAEMLPRRKYKAITLNGSIAGRPHSR